MDHFEKFQKQLISSYKSSLAVEGKEICKKIDSLIKDEKFVIDIAQTYCSFYLNFKKHSFDKDLFNKCKKFKYDTSNLRAIKNCLDRISETRKNQKKFQKNKLLNIK